MKINLEKELIKQNKKLSTPQELLLINEFEKVGKIEFDWNSIGFYHIKKGESIKNEKQKLKDQALKFKKERVFHISQIKSIAEKYYLRFLPSDLYKGSVDHQLPLKIGTFEALYDVKVNSRSFILAPKESFELEENPKDPLLFYKINDEYYYLIHKWGNDLSVLRMFKSILSGMLPFAIVFNLVVISILLFIRYLTLGETVFELSSLWAIPISGIIYFFVPLMFCGLVYDGRIEPCFYRKNEWNSKFKD